MLIKLNSLIETIYLSSMKCYNQTLNCPLLAHFIYQFCRHIFQMQFSNFFFFDPSIILFSIILGPTKFLFIISVGRFKNIDFSKRNSERTPTKILIILNAYCQEPTFQKRKGLGKASWMILYLKKSPSQKSPLTWNMDNVCITTLHSHRWRLKISL